MAKTVKTAAAKAAEKKKMLAEFAVLQEKVQAVHAVLKAPRAVEADSEAVLVLKSSLQSAAKRMAESNDLKQKLRIAMEMAAIVDRLPEGEETYALHAKLPRQTLKEVADRQQAANTVKKQIALGLRLAALMKLHMIS